MVVDLLVEGFADEMTLGKFVFAAALLLVGVEPQGHAIKEMKSRPLNSLILLERSSMPKKMVAEKIRLKPATRRR